MTELSQTLTTDYRTPQGDYQRIQYIPVSQSASGLQQPQHIQLQVVQVAPVRITFLALQLWEHHGAISQAGSRGQFSEEQPALHDVPLHVHPETQALVKHPPLPSPGW